LTVRILLKHQNPTRSQQLGQRPPASDELSGLVGFDATELERLLAIAGGEIESDAAEDEVPEPPEDPVSRSDDIWILGNHRLLCGDATVLADVERILGGQLADMTFCDPPYNVDYANTPKDKLRGKHRPILNDDLGAGFEAFLYDACTNIVSVTKGSRVRVHEQLGAAHPAARLQRCRREVVHVRDLGEEHLHPRQSRLPEAV
jgi:hypothetical protein